MKKIGALLCLFGGIAWAAKPLYDGLVLDRTINTGYPASDPTDYVEFLIPLFCLCGIIALLSMYGKKLFKPSLMISIGLVMYAGYVFSERFISDLPAGLFFAIPAFILLFLGTFLLLMNVKKTEVSDKSLLLVAGALFVAQALMFIYPFISGMLPVQLATIILISLMILVGLSWVGLGAFIFNRQRAL